MSRRQTPLLAALIALLTLIAACGTSSDDAAPSDTASATDHPTSIVSLAPTATEMLYAVGAGPQVKAVDDQSDYPADVPKTSLSGYTPNLEAILGYDPDLVVLADDNANIVAGLKRSGVQVLQLPAAKNLDDTYTQIEQVGAATGHVGDAAEVVARMRTEIDEIVKSVPAREEPLTYYQELDNTFYTITDDTYIGQIYRMLGLRSIATGSNAYPQLSAESIIADDPQIIFLADSQCCGIAPETVAARAGWGEIDAVKNGRVFVLDENIASRWGPRVVDLMRAVADDVKRIPVTAPAP